MLRQQSQSNVRIHLNIITYNHPINVIPASATLSVSCRALDMEEFKRIIQRIKDCAHAGAKAAGCEVKESWDRKYQSRFLYLDSVIMMLILLVLLVSAGQ